MAGRQNILETVFRAVLLWFIIFMYMFRRLPVRRNGAVCGAVLGAKLGYKRLPRTWVNSLRHKRWFHERVARFLKSGVLRLDEESPAAE